MSPQRITDRLSRALRRAPLFLAAALFIAGIVFWGGFNTALELTNQESFCISCHEMKQNVYREYTQTSHFLNPTGIRATCPDCHVPREWIHLVVRKVSATSELFSHLAGSIDSQQQFREKRLQLASEVWDAMKSTNSRECRNCHDLTHMDTDGQKQKSALYHRYAVAGEVTCIDCHKGIAHQLPAGYQDPSYEQIQNDIHHQFEKNGTKCYLCHQQMAHEEWDD